ncbi:SETD4 [Symbiodinium natans]|uniref:SETD4 protein n=1 Tax=Symbiodinium natans TaxID=878477 RepID=A0A812N3S1_9DINO|nr:SETD4 [Symbiodinium natans]
MLCSHVDQSLQRFLDWCFEAGIRAGSLDVRSLRGRGRLLQATHELSEDVEILYVPADAIISEGVASQTYQASHWSLGVAHRLVEEDCLGRESRFQPYVQLLLEGEPHDLQIMERLPGCAGSLAREKVKLRALHIAELCAAMPTCTADRAARAVYAVDSRTVYSHPAQARALVPFFDFVNHSACPNARWTMDSDGSLRLVTTTRVEIGEEVTISYDSIPNARLLVTYGFVLDGEGPHRSVDLNLPFGKLPDTLDEGGPDAKQPVQVQILGNGTLRRRAPLVPLLHNLCSRSETVLAEHLAKQVAVELEQWQAADAKEDSRLTLLIDMSVEVLQSFLERILSWIQAADAKPLMSALGPPEEAVTGHSTSDDSQDS